MNTIASGSRISHHHIADAHTKDAKADKADKADKTHNQQDAQAHGAPAAANTAHDKTSFRNAFTLAPAPIAAQLKLGAKALALPKPTPQAGQPHKNAGKAQNSGEKLAQATLPQNKVVQMLNKHKFFQTLSGQNTKITVKDGVINITTKDDYTISKKEINEARQEIFKKLDTHNYTVEGNGTLSEKEISQARPEDKKIIKLCNSLVPLNEKLPNDISKLKGKNVSELFGTLAKPDGNKKIISTQDLMLPKIPKAPEAPKPKTFNWNPKSGDYSFVVVPDTQRMIRFDAKHHTKFGPMLGNWIANNKGKEDIQFALSVGDSVNNGADGKSWKAMKRMYQPVWHDNIPLITAPGNHDYNDFKNKDGSINKNHSILDSYYKNLVKDHWQGKKLASFGHNALYEPSGKNGRKNGPLILSLEDKPNPAVIDWAHRVLDNHKKRDVIILTHDSTYKQPDPADSTKQKNLLDGLVNNPDHPHPNILTVFSGHHAVGKKIQYEKLDNKVSSFLADAQNADRYALKHGKLPLGMVLQVRVDSETHKAQLLYYSTVRHRYYGSMEVNLENGNVLKTKGHIQIKGS